MIFRIHANLKKFYISSLIKLHAYVNLVFFSSNFVSELIYKTEIESQM